MIIKTTKELGSFIRKIRKTQKLKQLDLAMAAGTGIRFISDLENGKATSELGKTLLVLNMLGLRVEAGVGNNENE